MQLHLCALPLSQISSSSMSREAAAPPRSAWFPPSAWPGMQLHCLSSRDPLPLALETASSSGSWPAVSWRGLAMAPSPIQGVVAGLMDVLLPCPRFPGIGNKAFHLPLIGCGAACWPVEISRRTRRQGSWSLGILLFSSGSLFTAFLSQHPLTFVCWSLLTGSHFL